MKKRNSTRPWPVYLFICGLLLYGQALLSQPSKALPLPTQERVSPDLLPAQAVSDTVVQEAQWQERTFAAEKLRQLQEDSDLVYPVSVSDDGWWSRLKEWFFTRLFEVLGGASDSGVLNMLIYLICIGAGIFLIVRFLNVDLSAMVRGRAQASPIGMGEGIAENIHELNFEQEIQEAVRQEDYRRAVRLVYLASLKRLADAGLVRWEPGKTNRQYQLELKNTTFKRQFASLGYYFEYAWYGDFAVDEPLFRKVEAEYRQFRKQLEVKA